MAPGRTTRRDALRLSTVPLLGLAGCATTVTDDPSTPTETRPISAGEVTSVPADHRALAWAVELPKPLSKPPTVDPDGDRIYVGAGDGIRTPVEDSSGGPFGALFSLRASAGAKEWGAATALPVVGRPVVNDGVIHVVTGFSSGFGGVDQRIVGYARDGKERWNTDSPSGTLLIVASAGDMVFAGTYDDALDTEGQRLFAVRSDGEVRWDRVAGDAMGAAVVGDTLLYNAGDSAIVAYDVRTGSESWRIEEEPIGDQRRWVVAFAGRCFTVSRTQRGEVGIVARSATDGSEQWRYAPVSPPGNRFVPTAVANAAPAGDGSGGGVSIVGTDYGGLVFALDDEGNERWTFETGSDVNDGIAVGDAVYVGDGEGNVYALDPDDGRERWRASLPVSTSVLGLSEGVLAFRVDDDGSVLASFRRDGTERWRYSTTKYLTWPIVDGDMAYVGAPDGAVLAFDTMA